jgi:RND family efflux transporter MFP subunit
MRKAIAAIVLLALLGLVGWVAYQRATKKGESNRPRERGAAVAVRLAPVERGMIRDVSVFTGSVKPNTYFVCAPKISGPLKSLLVNIGDRVKSGQVIGVIDDEEYRQQVAQAEAELEVAKASLEEGRTVMELARRELARAQSLYAKQVASEADLDEAKARFAAQEAKFRVAQASLAQRDAALKAAQVRLSYTRITVSWREAPADEERIVAEKFADAGAMLAANVPVVSIIDLDPVLAVINVIERDYSKIGIGHAATVTTDAFPDKTFTGKVVRVAPLLKEASRQARVEVEVPNKDGLLKPGMFVRSDL